MNTFESLLGVRPLFGGNHQSFGTKNALINLDKGIYLELLAADETNTTASKPRWMGVDCLTKNQITRWALKSDSLRNDRETLKKYHSQMGDLKQGSRNNKQGTLLSWELLMPLADPEVEVVPFIIDWSKSERHPSDMLPNMNCSFVALTGTHPQPEIFTDLFKKLGFDLCIDKGEEPALKLQLESPCGRVIL